METPADVAREIQANINQIRERLVEIEMLAGDEWPADFMRRLTIANGAMDLMEAECDKVRQESSVTPQ